MQVTIIDKNEGDFTARFTADNSLEAMVMSCLQNNSKPTSTNISLHPYNDSDSRVLISTFSVAVHHVLENPRV